MCQVTDKAADAWPQMEGAAGTKLWQVQMDHAARPTMLFDLRGKAPLSPPPSVLLLSPCVSNLYFLSRPSSSQCKRAQLSLLSASRRGIVFYQEIQRLPGGGGTGVGRLPKKFGEVIGGRNKARASRCKRPRRSQSQVLSVGA